MSMQARLSVVLKANDVVVAELEDPILWQNVLAAINNGAQAPLSAGQGQNGIGGDATQHTENAAKPESSGPLSDFASQLSLAEAQVVGACDPTTESPYLRLDSHCWEEMKRQLPQTGVSAIPLLGVPATLLALWMTKLRLGAATQAQAQAVAGSINLKDKNPSRSINNISWLQGRPGGQIVINPAEISKAVRVAKCFCSKDWSSWKNPEA